MWQRSVLCLARQTTCPLMKFSTTTPCSAIILRTRLRVVDNSALGASAIDRPPYCIHVYNKKHVGKLGDTVLVAIKGEKKKALVVGVRRPGDNMTPRFDTNNIILLEDNGNPTGTRITVPIPSVLRKRTDLSKVFAIATKFV
ncbi:putative 39S ribosomal protein L14, mitochondrial [Apostichopus japonicus]|uniref:Large ribosomal subunit protein uL14m n=1 Tax=Stichopus japonicus TaxID=307972 RepID=A0A2G8K1A0_STIJA|nr:putative 39S ribosomal protein L14, mitochondrial [Apostichopus japonicus]